VLTFLRVVLRVRNNPYIQNWEESRAAEIKELTNKGKIPVEHDLKHLVTISMTRQWTTHDLSSWVRQLLSLTSVKAPKEIVDEMVGDAVQWLAKGQKMV
jgi:hypothetical protein